MTGTQRCSVVASMVMFTVASFANIRTTSAAERSNWWGPTATKSGRFMGNLKIGPSIGVKDMPTQFAMVLDVGLAVTPDGNGYILFPFQLQFSGLTAVIVPVGFQYDIPLPVPGLYLCPRFSLGYAALFYSANYFGVDLSNTVNTFVMIPEFGAKYVLFKRWNFGFDPFSLPIFIGSSNSFGPGHSTGISYRLLFYGGANF